MKLLHIVASPRGGQSATLQVSQAFLDGLAKEGGVEVDVLDLYAHELPALAGDNIEAKYTLMMGMPIDKAHAESWHQIEGLIEHFISADAYLISAPMWNLSIPYALKYYIDCIVQPGYAFRYNEAGQIEPLFLGKRMVCITARGGDYSATGHMSAYDFQEPYLRAIFGLCGITDVQFINAEAMDVPPLREGNLAASMGAARDLAAAWSIAPSTVSSS